MALNPDATLDCLAIGHHLQRRAGRFGSAEIHLFAYLACLLSLYQREAITDWGYSFVGTELGAPFSTEIDLALKELLERCFISRHHDSFRMTTAAEERLATIRSLSLIQRRIQFLDAACASATALSIGMVSTALGSEPELNRSKLLPNTRLLLEDAARQQLYAQFDALRRGIGVENKDLRVPAVVWLTALYQYGTSGVGSL